MAELSNKTLALLVVAALAVVVVSTSIQLNKLDGFGFTGFAPYGNVSLTINDSLNIEVDNANLDIDFGTCTPAGSAFTVSSDDATPNGNCTGQAASGLDNLTVNNIGNVAADVNVTAECTLDEFLPEVTPGGNAFNFRVTGCTGTGQTSYTALGTSTTSACQSMTTGSSFYVWAQVTIDSDTNSTQNGLCNDNANQLTFSALQA